MIEFSLIIPTFNESKNIPILVPSIAEILEKAKITFEIIVVDDNSPDGTWKIAEELSEKDDRIRVIRRIGKRGLSSAVLDGMGVARGNAFGVIDADMQHDESILPKMINELADCDLVVGSRMAEEGGYGEFSFFRKLMSKTATLLAKIFLPIPVADPMSGFFVIKRSLFREVASEINPRGFKILLEFLGRKKGIRPKEVGYVFRNRVHGETKMSGSIIHNYILALYDIRFGKYVSLTFIKYGITGVIGIFVNLFGQYFANEILNFKNQGMAYREYFKPSLSVIFGFELSVFSNYILNNTWTFSEVKIQGFGKNVAGFIRFNVISILGLIIQLSVWRFSFEIFQVNFPDFYPDYATYLSNLMGILLATAGNYFLNRNFTWSKGD
ncbi:MAG: glycosyltransferase family 2 protein [Leptospira sp.]|nr:glycosyltransferase family 2 protein [Leptospira sp.]